VRSGAAFVYSLTGERTAEAAAAFAPEVAVLLREHAGAGRVAVDKIMVAGLRALEAAGLAVVDGEPLTERARAVKSADEVAAMRCALHACEAAMAAMRLEARPGRTENAIWSVLHAENIRRGGEWIETRLLASGPRTNPWFQECGPRVVRSGEVLAFDTDLIGPYGFCADISRTWWIGEPPVPAEVAADHALALEHMAWNTALLVPGASLAELRARAHVLPRDCQRQKYPCLYHGVGLCDEWPYVAYPDEAVPGAFEAVLEPGMTLCVEALVSREGARHSIKLEEQVLVTEHGPEVLSRAPLGLTFS
jgi:Xaa-Pro dipeptidase